MIEIGSYRMGCRAPVPVCVPLVVGLVAGVFAVAPGPARAGEKPLEPATWTTSYTAFEGPVRASEEQLPTGEERLAREEEQLPAEEGQLAREEEQLSREEEQVLAAVQDFFDGLAAGPEALHATLLEEGPVTRLRERDGTIEWTIQTFGQMSAATAQDDARMLERMWDATVLVHGPLAQVWTPYDFHVDGEFSHCGVDAFTLIKTQDGWKVSGVAYTVEPTGCEPSPLGPPR